MADRAQPLGQRLAAGVVLALVAALVLGTIAALALQAKGWGGVRSSDWAAVRFTLMQAGLSALLSVTLAIPVARALARQEFPGRRWVIAAFGAPFLLPVIAAVLGLLAVFGRSGWLAQGLALFGLPPLSIFGLQGVLLAHVFFNLPLAVRFILQGWQSVPAEQFRLAASLGLGPKDLARIIERPMLARVLPGTFAVVFLLCLTSFAVVLALGGGPRATTIELAIYQAVRLEFDLGRAAMLGLMQVALAAAVVLAALALVPLPQSGTVLDRWVQRWDSAARRGRDAFGLVLAGLFLAAPMLAVLTQGVAGLPGLGAAAWAAAARTVVVAVGSAFVTVLMALPVALWLSRRRQTASRRAEALGFLGLTASPLVIGAGLFLLIHPIADPARFALAVTGLVNAVLALPFALRALAPAAEETEARFGRLADSLALDGLARLRLLILPRLRRPMGFALGLSAALSAGDLGVIALFANPDAATLPMHIYRLMSAYRMDQAAAAALLLVVLAVGLFWIFDRGGRLNADL